LMACRRNIGIRVQGSGFGAAGSPGSNPKNPLL
jgi:hypothetical protein